MGFAASERNLRLSEIENPVIPDKIGDAEHMSRGLVQHWMVAGVSRSKMLTRIAIALIALVPFVGTVGCGYMVGGAYDPQIRSVAVPIFENDTFRRGIEFQLTEAVHKEIKLRTPYRLVNSQDAETRLTGRIVDIRKDVLGENQYDDPRELQMSLLVQVTWEDTRTGKILGQQEVPIDPTVVPVSAQADFSPEVGQSLATATQDGVTRLATKIVNMMETPW